MTRQAIFYPAPGERSPVLTTSAHDFGTAWGFLSLDIASEFGCSASDLSFPDITWDEGERFADFVTLDGRIIGSLDDQLTADEWRAVLATYSCTHLREALEASLAVAAV